MVLIDGRTSSPSYVYPTPDSPYRVTPLLTVGDEVPLLEGDFPTFTTSETETFAFVGIPDGMGVVPVGDNYLVFVNHEFDFDDSSAFSAAAPDERIMGARVSLFLFDQDFNVIGGRNLIDTAVIGEDTFTFNPETGFYVDSFGENFSFDRFCSAFLATEGFVDANGNEIPIYFAPEEVEAGLGFAVSPDGTALTIQDLGIYAKENIVSASQYRATNSDITVLIATEDEDDGELYLYVGEQTEADPNGFQSGDLYVLRVDGFDFEGPIPEDTPLSATWTLVDPSVIPSGPALSAFVNVPGVSTSFQRVEDIAEDPNNPGTFYFAITGTDNVLGSVTENAATAEEAENPFGRLYRFSLNPDDPTGPISDFELVQVGGPGNGVSYDNIVVDTNGNVLIQEDETAFGSTVLPAEGRDNALIWSYDIATDTVAPIFQLDESIAPGNTLNTGQWESSGIIEAPATSLTGLSSYLFDVQAHSISDPLFVEGGQLLLAEPVKVLPGTGGANTFNGTPGNDGFNGRGGNDTISGGAGDDTLLGGEGDDQIFGDTGNDQLDGGQGNNTIYAGEGNNLIIAGDGNDTAAAGAGDDVFLVGNGDNTVFAGEGNNRVTTGLGNDLIYTGAGNDIITAFAGNNTIYAGEGSNRILSGAGNDTVYVGAGDDIINTGAGNDTIYAGTGTNTITAGAGNDTIFTGVGNNSINAGAGDDMIYVGVGSNTITPGTGNDMVFLSVGLNTLVLNTGAGAATVFGFTADDQISFGSGVAADSVTFNVTGGNTLVSSGEDLLATLIAVELPSVIAA